MVEDTQNLKNESLDLMTNAGILRTTQKATIPGWGRAWFNNQARTNIFSYAEMAKRHHITYDSNIEDAFIVHLPHKKVKFTKTDQGLYVYKSRIKKTKKTKHQFMNTVAEKKIEIKRTPQEPPGFKFAGVNDKQDTYSSIAGVNENLPIVEEEIKNEILQIKNEKLQKEIKKTKVNNN